MAIDFNTLSDDDLLAMAGQFGIDVTPFISTSITPESLLEQIGTAPRFDQGLPSATLPPTELPLGVPEVTISPEAREAVAGIFDPIRARAGEELLRAATEAAGRRGLNRTDTPIFDPFLRSRADVETQLGGAEAGQLLNLSTDLRNFLQRQAEAREEARRFGGTFGLNLAGLQEQATQGRFGLENQALLNRGGFLEATRQFQQQFQNQLRQQAFQNRLSLGSNLSNLVLGLGSARQGSPTSMTQVGPLNLGSSLGAIGLGLQGIRNTGFF